MKTLYVLRHGIAVEAKSKLPHFDRLRPLTPKGREKIREIAIALRHRGVTFDLLLSSPLLRARETAEIVTRVFKGSFPAKEESSLEIGGNPKLLVSRLNQEFQRVEAILIVGHEPFLSDLISVLVTGRRGLSIVLKKGGLCKLSMERICHGRCATLEWLASPRLLIAGK